MSDEQKRILILEDSDIFADMVMSAFSEKPYKLERAVNGFEGIKKVYSFLPHLIITDIEMPLFKGYQVTRLLKSRKNTNTIPVVMFTSLDETKDKFWGNQAGADLYIEKSPDNLHPLIVATDTILSAPLNIDFNSIEREAKKINDASIIEIVNNLLDNKLFQTTVIGLLNELASKVHSMEMVASGVFDLLHTVCEAEIATLIIKGNKNIYLYTANFNGFTKDISNSFIDVCVSDFNKNFPDYKHSSKTTTDFFSEGENKKKIISYISVPLAAAGESFASLHIANTINDYFSPLIMDNINVFAGSASPVISNALTMHEMAALQNNTRAAFAKYVPADVMDDIINDTSKKVQMSENRYVSVLFSDIRNFTDISEHSEAQNVVDFLNAYFSKMGSEIISENGHIDKFIGDAIMAVFGAFQTLENSAANAVKASVKMLSAMEMINNHYNSISKEKIETGIGINCGECILGNIGFKNKMDFTVIGDTVNIASRLEGLTKVYHHPIIVSEAVFEETKEKYLLRKIDNVRVKGKTKPLGIYAVYSGFQGSEGNKLRSGEISDIASVSSLLINRETLSNYNKGLQVFYMKEWKLAQEYFKKALENDNNDYLSKLYLDRSIDFDKNPPPDNWDGVVIYLRK
jgi:class 3 adenylate cyclase/CheY-like chemotaxis protein